MAWISSLRKKSSSQEKTKRGMRFDKKIMLYVTIEEKELLKRRADEKSVSISYYVRKQLKPTIEKLREFYAGQTQEKKEN